VLALNPALYFAGLSTHRYPPDSLAYLTLASDMWASGLLYLSSWGHVDTGVILPPVYPALIGLAGRFSENLMGIGEAISTVSFVAAGVPLFLIARARTNDLVAALVCALPPLCLYYFDIAFKVLTEALFVLVVALALLAWDTVSTRRGRGAMIGAVAVGLLGAAAAMTRQVGLLVPAYLVALTVLAAALATPGERARDLAKAFAIVLGFAALSVPYGVAVGLQSGHAPWQQYFRMGDYVVSVAHGSALGRELTSARERVAADYADLLVERRQMRRLLPDASEMLSAVVIEDEPVSGVGGRIVGLLHEPSAYFERLGRNIALLREAIGIVPLLFFGLALLTPFMVDRDRARLARRLLLPGFVVTYLLGLSVFAGTVGVSRYIQVLIPFVLVHAGCEIHRVSAQARIESRRLASLVCLVLVLAMLAGVPRYFTALRLQEPIAEKEYAAAALRPHLRCREPVFSMFPMHAYLVGGRHLGLPDDSLERVADYARRTGTRYLLVTRRAADYWPTVRRYINADWFRERDLHERYPAVLEFVARDAFGDMELYAIRGIPAPASAAACR
jgi:hypothetical protein